MSIRHKRFACIAISYERGYNQTHVKSITISGSHDNRNVPYVVCHHLGLHYNPWIQLTCSLQWYIISSLGFARNIPCCVAISPAIYDHRHSRPAYDILMGRPFNVLTKSIVRTTPTKITLTICDPIIQEKFTTIPTLPRGSLQAPIQTRQRNTKFSCPPQGSDWRSMKIATVYIQFTVHSAFSSIIGNYG